MRIPLILLLAGIITACKPTDARHDVSASVVCDEPHEDTITIALTGDILMGLTYPTERLPQDSGRELFVDVAPFLTSADIAVGNLEGTLFDGGDTEKEPSDISYAFRTPQAYAGLLADAGYDFVSMANNHAFDFGIEGVIATEHSLDSVGIRYAGIRGRAETVVITRNGIRYGLCAFGHNGYTLQTQDTTIVAETIERLHRQADIIIVSFHGGAEGSAYSHLPDSMEIFLKEQRGHLRKFAHCCVRHGADIVYGHGPHVVRCVELYQDRFIAYSLGNFCTPFGISIKGLSGLAPLITVRTDGHGRFIDAHVHSFVQAYGVGPRADSENRAARQIGRLTDIDILDSRLEILANGEIRRK